ncbi:hypothetical protein SAMD00019534_026800 [Acytostelium subglobosum LB1]|uniref:hypothetical protein n=1 Tax=Acytostelium subglobosum LB1 TaxID=1410327 RepID=UPI0006451717|nr:hypothetical protein SAMD00019534_026800 [Acytostelium subglobosum LB1]GAM19505.1 hypothetical protein SAMD00019534_026800 [Acytostelium subglobosum LB1]|eukprot:XP_012757432.1 hypothetical protein SAMD00019534_026800 [Acytostelium subglobosum LB1]
MDQSGKPRAELFSVEYPGASPQSVACSDERNIAHLSPIPNTLFHPQAYEFKGHQGVDRSQTPQRQIELLHQIIEHNQMVGSQLQDAIVQLQIEQTNSYDMQVLMRQKMQELLDQNKTAARVSAHSNNLLKRTNMMSSELTKKNDNFRFNIKRLEDYLLTKDDCAKKLASVVYKHKISFESLLNPVLAAPVVYQIGSKLWKKGQEKKALGTLKDNFLFLFKNDKSKEPLDVVYLNDKRTISVSSSQDSSKKKTFFISIGTSIASEHELGSSTGVAATDTPSSPTPGPGATSLSASGSIPAGSPTSGSANTSSNAPTIIWCLLAFENQKDMEAWLGVLESAIPWFERKPNEISKPILHDTKKSAKPKQGGHMRDDGHGQWKRESGGGGGVAGTIRFPGVFGIRLEEVMQREHPSAEIPSFLTKMIGFLERNVQEEGILRMSGSSTEIQEMKSILQKGETIDFSPNNKIDTHAVAGLLKLYLRELPDLLVPISLRIVSAEIIADRSSTDDDKIVNVMELFKQVPKNEYNLMKHLIRFAKRITEQSEHNKMVLANVTTCFAQSLKGLIPGLFTFCVLHYEQIFVPTSSNNLGRPATSVH